MRVDVKSSIGFDCLCLFVLICGLLEPPKIFSTPESKPVFLAVSLPLLIERRLDNLLTILLSVSLDYTTYGISSETIFLLLPLEALGLFTTDSKSDPDVYGFGISVLTIISIFCSS